MNFVLTRFQKFNITSVLLITQHNINSSLTPLRFSGWRENFTFFKFLDDTYNTLTTKIQIKNQLNIFSFLFINYTSLQLFDSVKNK